MNISVSVGGTDALSLKVKYLVKAAQQGLKFGVPEATGLFVEEAKILVPVDSGNLRDSIHAEQVIDEPDHQVMAATPIYEADNAYGFDPAYARRIELGFEGPDSLGRVYHNPPQPYMRPAFEAKKSEAETAIKDSVFSALEDAQSKVSAARNRRG